MKKKVSLGEVLEHLNKLGESLEADKPLIDLHGILPAHDHHQTVVFIRLPYEGAATQKNVNERITKFLTSVNRPDTIKCDIFTILGANVAKGWQPAIKNAQQGKGPLFNPDWITAADDVPPFVLQITVDVIHPHVLQQVLGAESEESLYAEIQKAQPLYQKGKSKVVSFEELVGQYPGSKPPPKVTKGPSKADCEEDDGWPEDDDDSEF